MSDIKCPYCGEEDVVSEAWELGEGENVVQCENCEKEFIVEGNITLEFSSSRISCGDGNHQFEKWDRSDYDDGWHDRLGLVKRSNFEPHSLWGRSCRNCEERQVSSRVPLYSPLPEHLKED